MWCAHYLWWYSPVFLWWRSGTIIRLTAVIKWIRKITQPFMVNIVTETSTPLHSITFYMRLVSQPNIYSLVWFGSFKWGIWTWKISKLIWLFLTVCLLFVENFSTITFIPDRMFVPVHRVDYYFFRNHSSIMYN